MVIGCILALIVAMLKRRASKRFVLAESGQDDVAWDSTVDNIANPNIITAVVNTEQNLNLLTTGQVSEGLK